MLGQSSASTAILIIILCLDFTQFLIFRHMPDPKYLRVQTAADLYIRAEFEASMATLNHDGDLLFNLITRVAKQISISDRQPEEYRPYHGVLAQRVSITAHSPHEPVRYTSIFISKVTTPVLTFPNADITISSSSTPDSLNSTPIPPAYL